ncbi:MAG: polymer-forming cytoskeletal protein, partial [Verrucomicrobiota bacterium]|nr:polymer-forming cytoskeletal protein [Verrucomicrobiota bacterium]
MAKKNTPKQIEKISADCPHCGFSQLESPYAKSTFCRRCGEHYSIEKLLLKETTSLKGPSLFDRLGKLLARETVREVACLSCGTRQQLSSAAQSSICPQCGSYMDLRDFKITGPFGRSVQTQGDVVVTSKGDVSSARITCGSAFIEGKLRGALVCTGTLRMKVQGKVLGSIEAQDLIIEKRCAAEFVRPLKVQRVEINGKISARIMCEGQVTINKHGSLDGTVYARAISIEKGGIFSGELFIGQHEP